MNGISDWIARIMITAAAIMIVTAAKALLVWKKDAILSAIGITAVAIRHLLPQFLILFIDLLVMAYLAGQIYTSVVDPAPPTRADSALVAFWMCVLLWFAQRAFLAPLLRWRQSR